MAIFGVVGWFVCEGPVALLVACLLLAEISITAWDEVVENRTRVLPQNERFLHVLLTLNLGALTATLAAGYLGESQISSGFSLRELGVVPMALTFFALASGAWAVRDFRAWLQMQRAHS